MNESDTPNPETEPPRDRLTRLSEASLRINETLEFDNVLQEVVESARTLTGARYGMMATLNQSGDSEHFFSSGTTAEEHRQLEETPGGIQFFEHIRRIPEPMRVSDFSPLPVNGPERVQSAVAGGSVPCGSHPSPEGGRGQHLPRQGA